MAKVKCVTVSERMRELRAAAGLTQNELGVRAGVPLTTVQKIEQGQNQAKEGRAARGPTLGVVRRLLGALGAKLADLDDCRMEE